MGGRRDAVVAGSVAATGHRAVNLQCTINNGNTCLLHPGRVTMQHAGVVVGNNTCAQSWEHMPKPTRPPSIF